MVICTVEKAKEWGKPYAVIKGIDHRIDTHHLGLRDLTESPSTRLAGEKAGVHDGPIEVAELYAPFSHQEIILKRELGLDDSVDINPSGGVLAGNLMMASGLSRIGEVAKLFSDSGAICVTSFISPYRADRDTVRAAHDEVGLPFIEVYINCPLEVAEERDPKGLYKKARAGEIKGFTGIDAPYEEPEKPELDLHTDQHSVEESVQKVLEMLKNLGVISS